MDGHALWQERISACVDGELSAEEEQELMDHLDECEKCRSAMLLLRSMSETMREDAAEPPFMLAEGTRYLYEREMAQKKFSLKCWRFTAIAAVICVALLGVVTLVPRGGNLSSAAPAAEKQVAYGGVAHMAGGSVNSAELPDREEVPLEPESAADTYHTAANVAPVTSQPASAPLPAPETQAAATADTNAPTEEPGARNASEGTDEGSAQRSYLYFANALPGYDIYCGLEDPDQFYSVCFVYGPVPQTIRDDRACVPLEAPEGQERWLVPLSVSLNEGLQDQFQEIYYGDLLSQQGLVIGILDMEEEKWLP